MIHHFCFKPFNQRMTPIRPSPIRPPPPVPAQNPSAFATICKQSALARIVASHSKTIMIANNTEFNCQAPCAHATKPAGQNVESSFKLFFTLIFHASPQQAAVLRITKLQGNLQRTRPFYSNNSHLFPKPLTKLRASRSTRHKLKKVVAASNLAHWLPASWQSSSVPRLSAPSSKPRPFYHSVFVGN